MRIYERVKEGEVESEVKYKKGTREMKRIKASVHFFVARWGGGGAPTCPPLFSLSLSLSRSFLPVLLFLLWVYLS